MLLKVYYSSFSTIAAGMFNRLLISYKNKDEPLINNTCEKYSVKIHLERKA